MAQAKQGRSGIFGELWSFMKVRKKWWLGPIVVTMLLLSVLINTSFNVRGEPIVCTPQDAYLCFMRTNMDVLVLGNQILRKEEQPELHEDVDWRELYALD